MPYSPPNVDPFTIPTPDPTRHYRWLSDDPRRLALWLRSYGSIPGYRLEPRENAEKLGLSLDYVNEATGRIRYGYNVLASIPIEEYERRVRERLDEQLEKIGSAKERVHAAVDGLPGAKVIEREPEEHFDRKAHAERPSVNRTFVTGHKGTRPAPAFPEDR